MFGWKNQAILGADYDYSQDRFQQRFQFGALAPDRTLIETVSPLNNETVISLSGSNKIVGVYLTDMADFSIMNAVYGRQFEVPYPARTTIAVAALPLGAAVEIDIVAR